MRELPLRDRAPGKLQMASCSRMSFVARDCPLILVRDREPPIDVPHVTQHLTGRAAQSKNGHCLGETSTDEGLGAIHFPAI